jgi:hypothetical protein
MLLAAAISGILTGALDTNDNGAATARAAGGSVVADAMPLDGAGGGKHACKGKNACKGQGGCKTEKNACKGHNDCKGQGGCNTESNGDKGDKGKGK